MRWKVVSSVVHFPHPPTPTLYQKFPPSFLLSVLVLGFRPVSYTVSEAGVQAELQVVVLNGTIGSNITLSITTSDGSAVGM